MLTGLTGKKALITGAGRGIGRAIAQTLAEQGAEVCLLSRSENELQQVAEAIQQQGGKALIQAFDLSKREAYPTLKETLLENMGQVDILVHNAARVYRPKKLTHMPSEDWYKTLDVDLNAVFELNRLFLDSMKDAGWGRVITIGSLSGVVGVSAYPAYCAAKAALEGLTKNLAVDYSKYGLTVNMVSPGFVETERFQKAAPPELVEKFKAATAVKRLGTPEDIANAVAFLASEQASYITGLNMLVCGGLNLGNLW